jgi:hypothetical protein
MGINSQMDPKTKQLVEEAEARTAKATEGPWEHDKTISPRDYEVVSCLRIPNAPTFEMRSSNAEFIAFAHTDVPALCSAVREQDKRARHAEIERDGLNRETEAKATVIASLVAKLEAVTLNGDVVPTNENFVRVAMGEHHGKSEMRPEYVQEWARRLGPALDIIRARVAFKVKELEAKLADAIELAAEAIPYASDYFREKYEFESRLAKLNGTNTSPLPK